MVDGAGLRASAEALALLKLSKLLGQWLDQAMATSTAMASELPVLVNKRSSKLNLQLNLLKLSASSTSAPNNAADG